ncbi:unnamed protein product [Durusdinium trenchii]|uniref:EF-hand domain-containing protein n=2 Tax=Durusdinium trenchii TaxID=1381693 RepID=A0ABP0HTF1_9DINO
MSQHVLMCEACSAQLGCSIARKSDAPEQPGKILKVGDAPASEVESPRILSETFQNLMERLAHQHLAELSVARGLSRGPSTDAASARGSVTSPSPCAESLQSPGSAVEETGDARRRRRISQLMSQQHRKAPKMSASRIMKTFDESQLPQLPVETVDEGELVQHQPSTRLGLFREWLQSSHYEMCVAALLSVYVLWLGFELQVYGARTAVEIGLFPGALIPEANFSHWDVVIFPAADMCFTALFSIDVIVRVIVLRKTFWKVAMNYIDILVTLASFIEVIFFYVYTTPMAVNPMLFRLLRIGKLARAIRMVAMNSVLQSLQILTRCLVSSTTMLFWTFLLLTFFQCVAGLVAATLVRDALEDENLDLSVRIDVFRYYGTFTRTFLSMFEILFANWSPPCRVLVDNISEWFSVFFLIYRCLIGFAVLNVVNAVFVQQTMKIATSDEELAFKQKERELASYTRKVKNLFATMDQSGDCVINFEEFSKLVQSPMLQFLLSQLDLEYHDLLSLFEFLDNGDGEITLTEFLDGAAKLRGGAKALDIWRMETKIEVLFVEVLSALRGNVDVQEAFEEQGFRHVTFSTGNKRLTTVQQSSSKELALD